MIQIEIWILTLVIVLIAAISAAVAYIIGSWHAPHARVARDEAKHWQGRYNAEVKFRQQAELAAGENAPLGSMAGLEGLAQMFLGGEKFSLPKLLGVLKENPEMIGQILQLLKSGIPAQAKQQLPKGVPSGTSFKPMG